MDSAKIIHCDKMDSEKDILEHYEKSKKELKKFFRLLYFPFFLLFLMQLLNWLQIRFFGFNNDPLGLSFTFTAIVIMYCIYHIIDKKEKNEKRN